ncbi:MAG: hypothetical protein ACFUZC_07615 [Chthoniobacteraceae bacterium]
MDETPLQLLGINGGVDKHGITSVTVPFYVATLSEAISYTPTLDIDLPIVSRSFRQSEDGGYEVTLTCEGSEDNPTDDQKTFEIDASMAEEPIKTHPKFENLKSSFGWDESLSTFSEYLPSDSSSGGLASGSQNGSARKKSKMYGVESWLVAGAIYRVTYASKTVPQSIFLGIGTVQTPPSIGKFNLPNLGKRNWLKLAPKVRMRGNSIEISLEYMLSGPLGWFTEVYASAQLGESSSGNFGASLSD